MTKQTSSIDHLITIILDIFTDSQNSELAKAMKAYLKNKFEFFGIKTPERRAICKPILIECKLLSKKETLILAKQLWKQPQRECHYLAQELLVQNLTKRMEKTDLVWIEWFVTTNSWWDTVDLLATKILAVYFKQFPDMRKPKTDEWIAGQNIWLIRSAILFQLKYKDETDTKLLFDIILRTCHTKEFFINKAIGWILRENIRPNPVLIKKFITLNDTLLSPLSIREALKGLATSN